MPKTLYDKIWDEHLVYERQDGTSLLYVDRHLIHEAITRRQRPDLWKKHLNKKKK